MVRGVVDGCGLYDIIPAHVDAEQPSASHARELWLEISPRSFNVRVREGVALTQLMVFMPWDKVRLLCSFLRFALGTTILFAHRTLDPSNLRFIPCLSQADRAFPIHDSVPEHGEVHSSADAQDSSQASEASAGSTNTSKTGSAEDIFTARRGDGRRETGRPTLLDLHSETICFDSAGAALPVQVCVLELDWPLAFTTSSMHKRAPALPLDVYLLR
jgi:hypothetical protein